MTALITDRAALNIELSGIAEWRDAKKTVSLVEGIHGNTDLEQITDPHATEDIDFAILPGQFAVAENGAVWINDEGVRQRAIYFIAQHLALVVSVDNILPNMHEAYRRLSFGTPRFGAFISGPSKTADIEGVLVTGVHGPAAVEIVLLT